MRKIPTLFIRDENNRRYVTPAVTPDCEWVTAGEGVATRKYDGTCVMFDGEAWWSRREVKLGRPTPPGFKRISTDAVTGKTVGWEPISQSAFYKSFLEALEPVTQFGALVGVRLPPGTYELVGPRINRNPEGAQRHRLESHANAEQWADVPTDFEGLREFMSGLAEEGWEGIVWHHPDGRMAKLKVRDFPHGQNHLHTSE